MVTQKGNYNPYSSSPKFNSPQEKAMKYLPSILKMLALEDSLINDIKEGVNTISNMLFDNSKVSAHQIRNIFTLINEIDDNESGKNIKKLNMLRPKLAYIGARQKDDHGRVIVKVLDDLIINITEESSEQILKKKIAGLKYIMESIVAYHKYHSKN